MKKVLVALFVLVVASAGVAFAEPQMMNDTQMDHIVAGGELIFEYDLYWQSDNARLFDLTSVEGLKTSIRDNTIAYLNDEIHYRFPNTVGYTYDLGSVDGFRASVRENLKDRIINYFELTPYIDALNTLRDSGLFESFIVTTTP